MRFDQILMAAATQGGGGEGPSPKWSATQKHSTVTLSFNNRQATGGATNGWARGETSQTGTAKIYWESTVAALVGDDAVMGICASTFAPASWAGRWVTGGAYLAYRPFTGTVVSNGSTTATFTSATTNDVVMQAFDIAANKWWVGKNGTWFNSGDPAAGTGNTGTVPAGTVFYQIGGVAGGGTAFRFTAAPLAYTIPSGFTHWVTP